VPAASPERVRLGLHAGGQIDVWKSPARNKVVVAGRRWGKTLLARAWLLFHAINKGRGRYWYVAPTREDAKDIMWADLKAACHPDWLNEPPREGDLALLLKNGAEIRLWSAEKGDTLRGRALKALVLDEYADMDAAIYDEILMPALADFEAPALFIGTPKSFNHFYKLYERGPDPDFPDWASWQFKSISNPCLNPAVVEQAKHDVDIRTFKQEWEASFEGLSGQAYYAFTRAHNVKPVVLETGWPVNVCIDFNINPATATIGQVQGGQPALWREVKIRHAGGEATRAVARRVKALLQEAKHTGPVRIYGDATGKAAKTTGPADHAVLREVFPGAIWCIPSANPHEKDRVAAVNACCESMSGEHRLRIDPSCHALIADLEQVIFADNGELDKKSNPELTHLSDGLGYWLARDFPLRRAPVVSAIHAQSGPPKMSDTLAMLRAEKTAQRRRELGMS
jgi:hypothetical protein